MKRFLLFILILIIPVVIFTSCKKDKGDPPVLPPEESMLIDFSNFASLKKSSTGFTDTKGTENSSWEFAALTAGVWKVILNTTLIVPVSAFKAALNQTPAYLDDKMWQWSYSVTVANNVYKARLTGQTVASEVIWMMYVTKEGTGGFTEFLWFEGTSKTDGTGGQWTIYQSATVQQKVVQIDWTRSGDTVGKIIYTWVKTGDPFNTSYIEYGLITGDLDAYFTIHYYNGVKFSDVEIKWNTTTRNGRVKSLEYLENVWYCWDSNKINVSCE